MTQLRIGTRESKLALIQAEIVSQLWQQYYPQMEVQIVPMKTTGDILYNANLALVGGKGLFLKELEERLLDNHIDIAVHSLKDVPAFLPEGLEVTCFLEREDPRDAFISEKYSSIQELPLNARIGTTSARRAMQIQRIRPDIECVQFRGNVGTRLAKMRAGEVDGCILACAGLKRLGLWHKITQVIPIDEMLPAIGQGVICIEHLSTRKDISNKLQALNHKITERCVRAERAVMQRISGNCTTPMGAYGIIEKEEILLRAVYADDTAGEIRYAEARGPMNLPEEIGHRCSDLLLASIP